MGWARHAARAARATRRRRTRTLVALASRQRRSVYCLIYFTLYTITLKNTEQNIYLRMLLILLPYLKISLFNSDKDTRLYFD